MADVPQMNDWFSIKYVNLPTNTIKLIERT